MRVLVACEFSGTVRDAFIRAGHDAVSCDLRPSESPGPHLQEDAGRALKRERWDLVVAQDAAARFFRTFFGCAPRVAIENPIPHRHAVERIGRKYDQIVQPWQFGHPETKAVCLWLEGLPPLQETDVVEGREARVWKMAPGPDRERERSRFFRGIAEAMADQWGRA